VRAGFVRQLLAAAVAERIELFDIAEFQRRLRLDAGAQARLEGPVLLRIERPEGQGVAAIRAIAADCKNAGVAAGNRDDRRIEADFDRRAGG